MQIRNFQRDLSSQSVSTAPGPLRQLQEKIQSLLVEYEATLQHDTLIHILKLLESVKFKTSKAFGLFSENKTFREILLQKEEPPLSFPHESEDILTDEKLSHLILEEKDLPQVESLYRSLKNDMHLAWHYEATARGPDQVINQAIIDWQIDQQLNFSQLQALDHASAEPKGLNSFARDYQIEGGTETEKSKTTIETELKALVLKAKRTCPIDKRDLVVKWLLEKGGQSMNYFITDMFQKGEFKIDQAQDGLPAPTIIPKNVLAYWFVSNNNIYFYHAMVVKSVSFGNEQILMMQGDKAQFLDPTSIASSRQALKDINPLMAISTLVKLKITKDAVIPIVTSLQANSFTPLIKPPSQELPQQSAQAAASPSTIAARYKPGR